ncbi:hypothetical protein HYV79_04925 [Candidatus Woesearchaeota archaeon]|nr:hypothetical protein [Candidatus Woesearchaeota archaeon]
MFKSSSISKKAQEGAPGIWTLVVIIITLVFIATMILIIYKSGEILQFP